LKIHVILLRLNVVPQVLGPIIWVNLRNLELQTEGQLHDLLCKREACSLEDIADD